MPGKTRFCLLLSLLLGAASLLRAEPHWLDVQSFPFVWDARAEAWYYFESSSGGLSYFNYKEGRWETLGNPAAGQEAHADFLGEPVVLELVLEEGVIVQLYLDYALEQTGYWQNPNNGFFFAYQRVGPQIGSLTLIPREREGIQEQPPYGTITRLESVNLILTFRSAFSGSFEMVKIPGQSAVRGSFRLARDVAEPQS